MGFKTVEEMSGEEVVSAASGLAYYASACRDIGQGINSKETVRFNACLKRMIKEKLTSPEHIVEIECGWNPRLADFSDLLLSLYKNGTTREEMSALFV